jgi:hypothetical protein
MYITVYNNEDAYLAKHGNGIGLLGLCQPGHHLSKDHLNLQIHRKQFVEG